MDDRYAWTMDDIVLLTDDDKAVNGGKGSGNWGHSGRIGKVGGSGGGGISKYADMNIEEYLTAVETDFGSQADWDADQKDYIDDYASLGHRDVNPELRESDGDLEQMDEWIGDTILQLDKTMKNSLPEDTTLWRGLSVKMNLRKGYTITDHGFSSTTFDPSVAVGFAEQNEDYDGGEPYVMKIKAKKGQKGVITSLAGTMPEIHAREKEFILPRGLTYKIVDLTKRKRHTELEVEIVQ